MISTPMLEELFKGSWWTILTYPHFGKSRTVKTSKLYYYHPHICPRPSDYNKKVYQKKKAEWALLAKEFSEEENGV